MRRAVPALHQQSMTQALLPPEPPTAPPRLMRAAVLVEPQQFELRDDVPVPDPAADEIRVRLEGCGVCASNVPPWEGREWFTYPLAPGQLGHEGWGIVDPVGSRVSGLRAGERVAFLSNHAYAEYDVANADAVVALPRQLDDHPFPGEPLGCAMNIYGACAIERGQTVAIVGAGFLGALLTRLLSAAGATVFALSRRVSG